MVSLAQRRARVARVVVHPGGTLLEGGYRGSAPKSVNRAGAVVGVPTSGSTGLPGRSADELRGSPGADGTSTGSPTSCLVQSTAGS